jgi:ribonuclease Z
MNEIVILGSAMAVPDEFHENTSLAIVTPYHTILIDSPGSPLPVLVRAKIKLEKISDIILTHFHPDHVSGIPVLLLDLWLSGRSEELNIYGLEDTIDRMIAMLELYRWRDWPAFFPVNFIRVPKEELQLVLDYKEIKILSSPVSHVVPGMGIRVEWADTHRSMAYSSDTEPTDSEVKLARNVDLLIHESTGAGPGHSSATQAGEIAARAKARALLLIHYPVGTDWKDDLVEQAGGKFDGVVTIAKDLMRIEL